MQWLKTAFTGNTKGPVSHGPKRKRRQSKNGRRVKSGQLAFQTKSGKRVWLYAEHFGNFQADKSWVLTGHRETTDHGGSGRIRQGLPEWVWDALSEAPRRDLTEGEGITYLINGKKYQYLYNLYIDEKGYVYHEAYRRVKR